MAICLLAVYIFVISYVGLCKSRPTWGQITYGMTIPEYRSALVQLRLGKVVS